MSDVFISLRFGESMDEASELKNALEKAGASVFLCAVAPGGNIARQISHAIDECKLAVIMGTETYGRDTGAGFSTYEEMTFIQEEQKPFFLVKMCHRFAEPETRLRLRKSIAYQEWMPGTPMPPDLPENILKRLRGVDEGSSSSASMVRKPSMKFKAPPPQPQQHSAPHGIFQQQQVQPQAPFQHMPSQPPAPIRAPAPQSSLPAWAVPVDPNQQRFIAEHGVVNIMREHDGTIELQCPDKGHRPAISTTPLQDGATWTFHIRTLHNNHWVMFGVHGAPRQSKPFSYSDVSCYGWAGLSQLYRAGIADKSGHRWAGFEEGDIVTFFLDGTTLRMQITQADGTRFKFDPDFLPLGSSGPWHIHVNMYSPGDRVALLTENARSHLHLKPQRPVTYDSTDSSQRFIAEHGTVNIRYGPDGSIELTCPDKGHRPAISMTPLRPGAKWIFDIRKLKDNHWVYFGVHGNPKHSRPFSYNDRTSFGWAGLNQIYCSGGTTDSGHTWSGFEQGDKVILHLDGKSLRMQILQESGHFHAFEPASLLLPHTGPWFLHVNMYSENDRIALLPEGTSVDSIQAKLKRPKPVSLSSSQRFLAEHGTILMNTERDGTIVLKNPAKGHKPAIGTYPLKNGQRFVIDVRKLKNNHWLLVGVHGNPNHSRPFSYNDRTSFAWAGLSQVYRAGSNTETGHTWQGFEEGDKAIVTVENNQVKLQLLQPTGQFFKFDPDTLDLPHEGPWYVHINMYSEGDEVAVLPDSVQPSSLQKLVQSQSLSISSSQPFLAEHGTVRITPQSDQSVTLYCPERDHRPCIGTKPLHSGSKWSFKIDVLDRNHWVYFGVHGNPKSTKPFSYSDRTSYGWAGLNQIYRGGKSYNAGESWVGFEQGDTVSFFIDGTNLRMQVLQKSGNFYRFDPNFLELPHEGPWFMHVNMYSAGDQVTLLPYHRYQ